jgi:hypothetical protein
MTRDDAALVGQIDQQLRVGVAPSREDLLALLDLVRRLQKRLNDLENQRGTDR